MPGTMPSVDRDALSRLKAGDEQVLRRIFDDHYPALTQEASTLLDDPVAAPRVVENVFVRVWDEREDFESPEALEAFLHQATREAAARAQSRRASIHRFESHEGVHAHDTAHGKRAPATAEETWSHLEHTLHARADRSYRQQEVAAQARHAAATHVGEIEKRRPWLWPALGIAAVAIVVLTPIFFVDRASEDRAVANGIRSREARTLVANQGERTAILLTDSTNVRLGGESRLTVPPGFGERLRGVGLQGTATFTVAQGQERVFQVRAKNAVIRALGTEFAVRAYADENFVAVRVKEGEVAVEGDDETRRLTAGQALIVDDGGALREPTPDELDAALGWTEGRLVLRQMPVRDALKHLQRWYALGLVVRDSAILDRPVAMNVSLDSSRTAISALEKGADVKFGYEGRIRVLRDARKSRT
jgi:ferric-dicitrate binding protein FerR (iron transport regulator)